MISRKTGIIIKREYLSRIKKKSFVILSLVGPLFFASLFVLPGFFMHQQAEEVKKIAVIDSSKVFINKIPETNYLKFEYLTGIGVDDLKKNFRSTGYYAVLYIAHIIHNVPTAVQLMSDRQPAMNVTMHISNALEKEIEKQKLFTHNITNLDQILASVKTNIRIQTIKWTYNGKEKKRYGDVALAVSYIAGFLIYVFILMFCAQVMRGVVEEKTNRIVEIIISSVKPMELMMGKILGIALVGLTQFILWFCMSAFFIHQFQRVLSVDSSKISHVMTQDIMSTSSYAPAQPVIEEKVEEMKSFIDAIQDIDFVIMILSFVFFFIFGYLLYAAIFAAIGAMIDNDTDTQQFILLVTMPLILALLLLVHTVQNPDTNIAVWFSIIPFTSPIIMMVRIPYGVPYTEFMLSAVLLVLFFLLITWLSAKIYRTAILLYGRKISIREILRWVKS